MAEQLVKNIESKLQFAVALSLFFPVVLEALFTLADADSVEMSTNILRFCFAVFLLIINWLLFDWRKNKLPLSILSFFSWTGILVIICFATLFLFFGFVANGSVTNFDSLYRSLYIIALTGIIVLPFINLILIALHLVYTSLKNKEA